MLRRLVLYLSTFSVLLFAAPAVANATGVASLFSGACNGPNASQAANSAFCKDKNPGHNPLSGNQGIIIKVTRILAIVAGMAAVIIMIVGGIKYITAGGDSNAITAARNTILNALIGLIIIVLAQSIIVYIVKKIVS